MGFGKDNKGAIISEARTQVLTTLANDTVILIGTKLGILERYRMLKSIVYARITGLTAGEGSGLVLGLADGDFTAAEIAQALTTTNGPLGPNDQPLAASAERFIVLVGAVHAEQSATIRTVHDMNGNGPICVVKPRWTFARTKSWNWFILNRGVALTTGSQVRVMAKSFGVWVT